MRDFVFAYGLEVLRLILILHAGISEPSAGAADIDETLPCNIMEVPSPPTATKPEKTLVDQTVEDARASYQAPKLRRTCKAPPSPYYNPYPAEDVDDQACGSEEHPVITVPGTPEKEPFTPDGKDTFLKL